jgi:hypothetical protein
VRHRDRGLHRGTRSPFGRYFARVQPQPRGKPERSQHGPTDTEPRGVPQKNAPIDPSQEQLIEQGILDIPQRSSGSVDRFARPHQAALLFSRPD